MKVDIQARGFPLTEALTHSISSEAAHMRQSLADRLTFRQVRLFDANANRAIAAAFNRLRRAALDHLQRQRTRQRAGRGKSPAHDRSWRMPLY